MLDQITEALRHCPGVHDWIVEHVSRTSTQYYLVADRLENARTVRSETLVAEVMNDHGTPGGETRRGSGSITLLPSDLPRLAHRLDEAVFMASLVDNQPYSLPAPAPLPTVASSDAATLADPIKMAEQVARELQTTVSGGSDVRLSSAEVFIESASTELRNSRGIAAVKSGTEVFLDFVVIAASRGVEMESSVAVHRRRVRDLDAAAIARRYARYARDALTARLPTTGRWPVLVTDEAAMELLAGNILFGQALPLTFRANAQAKYQQLSPLEIGQSIFGNTPITGDPLNVYSNSLLPYGLRTWAFDREGLAGHRLPIVENGSLTRWIADQRHADYLGIEATGEFGNLEISAGSMPLAEMSRLSAPDERLIQVVIWSFMTPDVVTCDFVGEIRLGYEITRDGKRPIKGGSVSGNLFAALAGARFSQETALMGSYQGPMGVRLPGLTVSGAQ